MARNLLFAIDQRRLHRNMCVVIVIRPHGAVLAALPHGIGIKDTGEVVVPGETTPLVV